MRLADFIEFNAPMIIDGAEAFAATQTPPGVHLDSDALRDHLPEVLAAIVLDLRTSQSAEAQHAKSEGRAPIAEGPKSAASSHGGLRAKSGFRVDQMVAEYRALRAAVLRLWLAEHPPYHHAIEDMIRFNEAIDQAVAESVADFSKEVESYRQLFLGALGHDLRGPLNVIVISSELLSLMAHETPYSEQIDRIIRGGKRMTTLLDDLLDYSRSALGVGTRIVRSEVDLQQALTEEIKLLRAAMPEVKINFNASGPTREQFDGSRIREALSNLVTNAAKYGDSGADILVAIKGDGQRAEIVVCNDGPALPSDGVNALFEPLLRGPNAVVSDGQTSLGLGLFIVREIVRAHGGEVTATSTDGTTAFTMRLPKCLC